MGILSTHMDVWKCGNVKISIHLLLTPPPTLYNSK